MSTIRLKFLGLPGEIPLYARGGGVDLPFGLLSTP